MNQPSENTTPPAERATPITDAAVSDSLGRADRLNADEWQQKFGKLAKHMRGIERQLADAERIAAEYAGTNAGLNIDLHMAKQDLADARNMLKNAIAERDQLRRDYNESRENHWQTLEMLKLAQDQRDLLRGMLDGQEASDLAALREAQDQRDRLAEALQACADDLACELDRRLPNPEETWCSLIDARSALAATKGSPS